MNQTLYLLLHILTHCVRLLAVPQILRLTGSGQRQTRDWLQRLCRQGFVKRQTVWSAPLLTLSQPLASWKPGVEKPNLASASYRAQRRWTDPVQPTVAYLATERAARVLGGRGGVLRHPLQATHDLHVAQIYLAILETQPDRANRWISEDLLTPCQGRGRRPDAAIVGADSQIETAIEFCGSYGVPRIASCHRSFSSNLWAYELW